MAAKRNKLILIIMSLSHNCFFISTSHSATRHTILQGQQLRDWEQLTSADGIFNLKFFSPGTSTNRYLGILTYSDQAVWVANRNTPISDTSGVLILDESGRLLLSYGGGSLVISTSGQTAAINVSATLLDSGNLVLREVNSDGSEKKLLWQSFDHPTDTLLPGMKLGINFKTGQTWSLTSWINEQVPASGSFTLGGDPNGTDQLIMLWQGKPYWTSGLWYNGSFKFAQGLNGLGNVNFNYISNENEKYLTFSTEELHIIPVFKMDPIGKVKQLGAGTTINCPSSKLVDGWCGDDILPECGCASEKSPECGCVGEKLRGCRNSKDRFERKIGYATNYAFKPDGIRNYSIFDCWDKCWNNCSCIAYASTCDNQTCCEIWSNDFQGDLIFVGSNSDLLNTRDIYTLHRDKKGKWWIWFIIAVAAVVVIPVLCYLIKKLIAKGKRIREQAILLHELETNTTHFTKSGITKIFKREGKNSHELRFFTFESLVFATNNFAESNRLGEGGYGPVYKGKLQDGQEIAIKRLSRSSGQGPLEFKNELALIAKLQHTNLVRLVGCCIEREEKILIYEYMPNKSLDFFLFAPTGNVILNWKKRFNIIEGIAQGLIYLHKYSRFKIIHRDLKVSNILLDDEMNPKISDFGMARIFGRNESEANTKRIVGTYGYMSPEYAMEGIFSIKSDVFSFGVLLLEIVSGKKNNSYFDAKHQVNIAGHAWELWREDRALELMDQTLGDSYHNNEVLRCIQVGLLCVQDIPADRPTMSDVVSMISNEAIPLPAPKQPAFFISRSSLNTDINENRIGNCSLNGVTISELEAR